MYKHKHVHLNGHPHMCMHVHVQVRTHVVCFDVGVACRREAPMHDCVCTYTCTCVTELWEGLSDKQTQVFMQLRAFKKRV